MPWYLKWTCSCCIGLDTSNCVKKMCSLWAIAVSGRAVSGRLSSLLICKLWLLYLVFALIFVPILWYRIVVYHGVFLHLWEMIGSIKKRHQMTQLMLSQVSPENWVPMNLVPISLHVAANVALGFLAHENRLGKQTAKGLSPTQVSSQKNIFSPDLALNLMLFWRHLSVIALPLRFQRCCSQGL